MQIVAPETLVVVENGGNPRIIFPGNNPTAFMCRRLAEAPVASRTDGFTELKQQVDAADADIMLVNQRLDEAWGK